MLLLKNSSSTLTGRNVRLSNLLISSCRILALTGWERNCPGNVLYSRIVKSCTLQHLMFQWHCVMMNWKYKWKLKTFSSAASHSSGIVSRVPLAQRWNNMLINQSKQNISRHMSQVNQRCRSSWSLFFYFFIGRDISKTAEPIFTKSSRTMANGLQ